MNPQILSNQMNNKAAPLNFKVGKVKKKTTFYKSTAKSNRKIHREETGRTLCILLIALHF